jgi:hypothetical protein
VGEEEQQQVLEQVQDVVQQLGLELVQELQQEQVLVQEEQSRHRNHEQR